MELKGKTYLVVIKVNNSRIDTVPNAQTARNINGWMKSHHNEKV